MDPRELARVDAIVRDCERRIGSTNERATEAQIALADLGFEPNRDTLVVLFALAASIAKEDGGFDHRAFGAVAVRIFASTVTYDSRRPGGDA